MTIIDILSRNNRLFPDKIALTEISPSKNYRKEITWHEFNNEANRFANALIQRGVKKGDIVLHMMVNSIDWLVAYFGILKTGAMAAPLNFRFLARQIKYCADIAEPVALVMDANFKERIQSIRNQIPSVKHFIYIGDDIPEGMESYENIIQAAPSEDPDIPLSGEDNAGLYFTSGTTGEP